MKPESKREEMAGPVAENEARGGGPEGQATTAPDLGADAATIQEAFALFTKTTQSMEESYRRLETRVQSLDQELQARNQELALTTDYLHAILDSMSDGVIAVDVDGSITTFNRAACQVLGHRAGDVVGERFRAIFGRDFPVAPMGSATELPSLTGQDVPISARTSPIADRGGAHIGSVAVFQDLTEIEALRRKMRHKEHLASIGEMAATVAHEIRNPLGGIHGFATLLQRDLGEGDPRSRLVQKILTGTKNLERVVNELLEFTRPVEPSLKTADCARLVDAAVGYVDTGKRAIEIYNRVDAEARVFVDIQQIRQVLLNILINAVQSIENEGTITVTSESDAAGVVIAVADTGCGIPEDRLGSVFSPFYTTKEKGTGLGLALASKIVASHGGAIEVTSEEGAGSVFRIRLPRGD